MYKNIILILSLFLSYVVKAQVDSARKYLPLDYSQPAEYIIAGIETEGNKYIDKISIIFNTNLSINQKIKMPGNEIPNAIENLWKQGYFSNVVIYAKKIEGNKIYLMIQVSERPRLSKFGIIGIRSSEKKNLREALSIKGGIIINEDVLNKTKKEITKYYYEKGYYAVKTGIKRYKDTIPNREYLMIDVDKGKKVKVYDIEFVNNNEISDKELRKLLKKTKRKRHKLNIFKSSKFINETYQTEKDEIIKKYNNEGYRDAIITFDSVVQISPNRVAIKIGINEGKKYYFRNIDFTGNNKFSSSDLHKILGIKKGDVYNLALLEERVHMSPNSTDITSLYMDDGYLFFSITPVETRVENDSIDFEIRIVERAQATVNKIIVTGNTKTSDHVILRELRTRPGQKFSRSDIQRSVRELSQLGYFDPQAMNVVPYPNAANGTVDIEYKVAEKANDQIELSGGWGGNNRNNGYYGSQYGYGGLVGTLGLTLNNFSTRKLFNMKEWNPLPAGDGQKLSIRAQSNGLYYQSYNFSFTEPWLGGKKPNSLSVSVYRTNQSFDSRQRNDPAKQFIKITGASVSLGKRLKWPDDFFSAFYSLSYQQYALQNANGAYGLQLNTGNSNNLEFKLAITRNSVNEPIYPREGSSYSLSMAFTPPVSAFNNKDYSNISLNEKYKFIEYHKWKFDTENYTPLAGKLVLATKTRFGFLGYYNKALGLSPFERFVVGGSGLNSFGQIGSEIISMRGYPDRSISTTAAAHSNAGAAIFNKFTAELRYPLTNSPSATIYFLTFLEAGNAWMDARKYNMFDLRRSAGVGVRLFLPMFGLLGLDYAYGFDYKKVNEGGLPLQKPTQFHFFIGQQF